MASLFAEIKLAYQRFPEKHALVIDDNSYRFDQLQEMVETAARHFHQLGVVQGDKVLLVLPNNLEFVVAMLALAELNACLAPLPLGVSPKTFAIACKNTNAQHVIAWHAGLRSYLEITTSQNISIKNWISVGKELEFAHSFHYTNSHSQRDHKPLTDVDVNTPYILTMTSGSTGTPKPITLNQLTKIKRAHSAISLYNVTSEDTTLIATPLYHSLAERLIFVSLLSGGTAVLMPKFTIQLWLEQIAKHSVTFSIAVSSQLKQILSCNLIPDLSSLRCIVSSSALLDVDIKQKLLDVLNCEFHECYGASEIAIATNIKFDRNRPIHSVGKAIPHTSLLILDDDRHPVTTGEVGEIACKTPMAFSGYYEQTENTKTAYHRGYFCTGDLGKLDKEGNLYFVGRKKELIITGGINIYPSDVEAVIKTQPQVETAVAFALKDDNLGEIVALAVTLSAVNEDVDKAIQTIRINCATELDAQQQPRKYFVFEQLPQNAMGKINKIEITALAEKRSQSNQWLYKMEQN